MSAATTSDRRARLHARAGLHWSPAACPRTAQAPWRARPTPAPTSELTRSSFCAVARSRIARLIVSNPCARCSAAACGTAPPIPHLGCLPLRPRHSNSRVSWAAARAGALAVLHGRPLHRHPTRCWVARFSACSSSCSSFVSPRSCPTPSIWWARRNPEPRGISSRLRIERS